MGAGTNVPQRQARDTMCVAKCLPDVTWLNVPWASLTTNITGTTPNSSEKTTPNNSESDTIIVQNAEWGAVAVAP